LRADAYHFQKFAQAEIECFFVHDGLPLYGLFDDHKAQTAPECGIQPGAG
jgi:hypothetical protein